MSSAESNLLAMRLALGWSQVKMARRLGKSLRQYRAWEKGEYPVPVVVGLAVERLAEMDLSKDIRAEALTDVTNVFETLSSELT